MTLGIFDECDHGDDPLSCPPCQRQKYGKALRPLTHRDPLVAPADGWGASFVAQYEGRCAECDGAIAAGEQIQRMSGRADDERAVYRHALGRCG